MGDDARMTLRLLAALLMSVSLLEAAPLVLKPIAFEVIHDARTLQRDEKDRRYSVWTEKDAAVGPLMKDFGLEAVKVPALKPGQILAVFLNDKITDDLTAIIYNHTANAIFADYADSGIRFKMKAPDPGKKYSHLTVVIFSPPGTPSHLGVRAMQADGLSEKKE